MRGQDTNVPLHLRKISGIPQTKGYRNRNATGEKPDVEAKKERKGKVK